MKNTLKRLGALLIAAIMMIAMCVPVMADQKAGPVTTAEPTTTPLFNQNSENEPKNYPTKDDKATITVNGFVDDQVNADNVYAYQIVKALYNQNGQTGFSGYIAMVDVIDVENPVPVTSLFDASDNPIYPNSTQIAELAENNDILSSSKNPGQYKMTKGTVGDDGTVAFTAEVPVGEYLILAKSKDQETIYNPMVVSVYYTVDANGNEVVATKPISANEWWGLATIDAYVKTSTPTVLKEIVDNSRHNPASDSGKHGDDHAIGDTVDFKITSMIPSYSAMFENTDGVETTIKPIVYNITDTMEAGLSYDSATGVTVKVGSTEFTAATGTSEVVKNDNNDSLAFTYNVVKDDDNKVIGYKLVFAQDFILAHDNETVTVTYKAEITDAATCNYNANENTVDLEYTIDHTYTETDEGEPNNTTHQEDTTYHYTFEIDGDVLGGEKTVDLDGDGTYDEYKHKTHELVKMDENGDETAGDKVDTEDGTTETQTLQNPLAGAVFELTRTDEKKGNPAEVYYAMSDATGHFAASAEKYEGNDINGFKGLDAGTYTLKEVKAPEKYSLNKTEYEIVIAAEYYDEATDDHDKGELESYTITITNKSVTPNVTNTTTHIATYNHGTITTVVDGRTTVNQDTSEETFTLYQASTYIKNTKLTDLPSTGGMGSYLFTIIGVAVMAIVAGSYFRSRAKKA